MVISLVARMNELIKAQFIGNRVVVWDLEKGTWLYNNGFYGKPIGVRKPNIGDEFRDPLELSYFEAFYLQEKKIIEIFDEEGNLLDKEQFLKRCRENHINFDQKMEVYNHLREKGYVVKPGLKFGTDFAVYTKGPGLEHSPYLVQIIKKEGSINPIELVRAGRLATTVRKNFVLATKMKGKLHFFLFDRYKP
ncbi:MAG: tRNA-intron lyase [Candidatus Heimdallarchaeaceae archaeon]